MKSQSTMDMIDLKSDIIDLRESVNVLFASQEEQRVHIKDLQRENTDLKKVIIMKVRNLEEREQYSKRNNFIVVKETTGEYIEDIVRERCEKLVLK